MNALFEKEKKHWMRCWGQMSIPARLELSKARITRQGILPSGRELHHVHAMRSSARSVSEASSGLLGCMRQSEGQKQTGHDNRRYIHTKVNLEVEERMNSSRRKKVVNAGVVAVTLLFSSCFSTGQKDTGQSPLRKYGSTSLSWACRMVSFPQKMRGRGRSLGIALLFG